MEVLKDKAVVSFENNQMIVVLELKEPNLWKLKDVVDEALPEVKINRIAIK